MAIVAENKSVVALIVTPFRRDPVAVDRARALSPGARLDSATLDCEALVVLKESEAGRPWIHAYGSPVTDHDERDACARSS
jgi:hypothetical protein